MKKTYDQMTLEELQKQEKTVKTVRSIFVVIGVLLIVSNIFIISKEGFSISSIIPFSFLPLYILIFYSSNKNLKLIQEEINKRNSL